jgi:hypothetical protein
MLLHAFSSLKIGGITIDSALQVGFMVHSLLSRYHAVVQKFRLGRHPLSEASLQTVVDQCVNYNKDLFLHPVGKDGKIVRTPSANAATGDGENAYNALAAKSFNYHFGWWKKALAENKGKCMFCHDTARNADYKSRDCPILKQLGLKLEKRVESDNTDAASRVTAPPTADPAKLAPAPAPSLDTDSGSGTLPGGFLAAAEPASYDLGDKYDHEGKSSGSMYLGTPANSKSSRAYLSLPPSCCHASSKASPLNKLPV